MLRACASSTFPQRAIPAGRASPGQQPKWKAEYSEFLRDADIVILPDNDEPGRAHADTIARMSARIAKRIRILDLAQHWPDCPKGGDISDWLAAGHSREELDRLIEQAADSAPPSENDQGSVAYLACEGLATGNKAHLSSRCAADIEPNRIDFLWPGRLARGKHTAIAGEPGDGKSQLSVSIAAAAISRGGEWPCGEGRAPIGNVIIFNAEDGAADTVVPRLMAAGADLERVHIVSAVIKRTARGADHSTCRPTLHCSKRRLPRSAMLRSSSSTRSAPTWARPTATRTPRSAVRWSRSARWQIA